MSLSPRALPWIIAAAMLFFVGVLALGLWHGELTLPTRGGSVHLQRGSNAAGFYAVAAGYAALAAACAWLLVAVLRAPDRGVPGTPRNARGNRPTPKPSMQSPGSVQISQDGRSGRIFLTLASGSHQFSWEFGGGDCIAIIDVPDPAQWPKIPALASHPRADLLQWLADEVARRQCPNARIVVGDRWIEFRE